MDQATGIWRAGAIVWREAATSDLGRTTVFYSELLGWSHHDSDMGPRGIYRHFEAAGKAVAGCYQLGPDMAGVPPHWLQYISVSDVDAAAKAVTAHGGKVMMGPLDIPDVGRAVYVKDPQGAAVALFHDLKGDGAVTPPPYPQGAFCWETLNTTDKKGALAFYAAVVGHKIGDFFGSATLATGDGPQDAIADVGDAPPGVPAHWLSHVVVKNLAESRARATTLGGTILMAEIVVPHVGKMAIINDPVGATISLFEAEPRGGM
jgi:predicted enzyme related to lactoylglutathione lyase